jgi:hypothetical protein
MNYRIKNMTYQPVRLVINNKSERLLKRRSIVSNTLTDQMINLNKKGIIQVKEIGH